MADRGDRAERAGGGEAGFSLVEVVVCVALLVTACVSALALLPSLVHASQGDIVRDAAANAARTAIDRVRAATAYYPASGYVADHAYALNANATYATVAHVHRAWCGATAATTNVPMNVTLTYDATSDAVAATVTYPRDACAPQVLETIVLHAQLAPSALAPGTTVATPIDDPSLQ